MGILPCLFSLFLLDGGDIHGIVLDIYKYTLNEDLCIVDYKNYYQGNYDEPPVLSICLRDPISEDKLRRQVPRVDRWTYLGLLNGSNFNVTLVNIDYEAVTLNISELNFAL